MDPGTTVLTKPLPLIVGALDIRLTICLGLSATRFVGNMIQGVIIPTGAISGNALSTISAISLYCYHLFIWLIVVVIIRIVSLFCIIADAIYIVINVGIFVFSGWVAYIHVCIKINSGQNSIFSWRAINKTDHAVNFNFAFYHFKIVLNPLIVFYFIYKYTHTLN